MELLVAAELYLELHSKVEQLQQIKKEGIFTFYKKGGEKENGKIKSENEFLTQFENASNVAWGERE